MPKINDEKKKLIENLIRNRVYEEAIILLKQERYDVFTMAELAESVGIAKGTLYNYFSNKLDVIYYVYERLNNEFMDKIKKYFSEHPHEFENNLRYFIHAHIERRQENRFLDIAQLSFHYEMIKNNTNKKYSTPIFKSFMTENRKFMTEFFSAGQKAGVFKDYDPKFMASFIDIYLLGMNAYTFLRDPKLLDSEIAKKAFPQSEEMLIEAVCIR